MAYYSGQGKLYLAGRDASGNALPFRFLGNVPDLTIDLQVDKATHKESVSGSRVTDLVLQTAKSANVAFTLEEFSADNLALGLYGAKATIAGSNVTNEILPNPVVVGDFVRLKQPKVSAVVVTDSTGSPITLVQGTHYRVANPDTGTIEILSLTGVQPFKAAYTYGGYTNLPIFNQPAQNRWLRFEGLNTADTNKPVLVELYNVQIEPIQNWGLLTDEIAKWQLTGECLYDATKSADTLLSFFGRVAFL